MTTYSATIRHHSIASARIETFEAATVAAAKRIATKRFSGELLDAEIWLWDGQPENRWDSNKSWIKRGDRWTDTY